MTDSRNHPASIAKKLRNALVAAEAAHRARVFAGHQAAALAESSSAAAAVASH
jgi:hypothetical protein